MVPRIVITTGSGPLKARGRGLKLPKGSPKAPESNEMASCRLKRTTHLATCKSNDDAVMLGSDCRLLHAARQLREASPNMRAETRCCALPICLPCHPE